MLNIFNFVVKKVNTVASFLMQKPDNEKVLCQGSPALKQAFPFPKPMIYYMTMNPSSAKAYNKMIQTCKYFFKANPILVVGQLCEPSSLVIWGKTRICSKVKHEYNKSACYRCIYVNLRNISSKIWITNKLFIFQNDYQKLTSFIRAQLYRCEIDELFLSNVTIPFNFFEILVQSVAKLELFWNVKILDTDENPVLLDKILAVCPKIQYFLHDFSDSSDFSILATSTLKDISKLQNLSNLKEFEMWNIPEIFDIQHVSDFLTKKLLSTTVKLRFNRGVSEEYKVQLNAIREKICEEKIQNHNVSFFL